MFKSSLGLLKVGQLRFKSGHSSFHFSLRTKLLVAALSQKDRETIKLVFAKFGCRLRNECDLGGMWKETVVAYFNASKQRLTMEGMRRLNEPTIYFQVT
jgi:hypothetical protein